MEDRSIREIIREELKKLSQLTWGQRLGYIWDYYKPLMVAILVIIGIVSMGISIYRNLQQEHLLSVYMIDSNAAEVDTDQVTAEFSEFIGGLGTNQVITIDNSISIEDTNSEYGSANLMKLTALTAAGDVDILLFDEDSFRQYLEMNAFGDLREILSEEQLEDWHGQLTGEDGKAAADGTAVYALELTDAPVIQRYNAYNGERVFGCVLQDDEYAGLCDDFFAYLMTE